MPQIDLNPNKNQVNLAQNKPLAYVLVVVIILLGIVTTMYFRSTTTIRSDCLQTVQDLRVEVRELKAENKELREYVIKTNTDINELKANTEAAIRDALNSKK